MDNTKELRACVIIYKGQELPSETRDKIVTKIIKDCNVKEQADLFILSPIDIAKTLVNSKIQFNNPNEDIKKKEIESSVVYIVQLFSNHIISKKYFDLALDILKNIKKPSFQTLNTACEIISNNVDEAKEVIRNRYHYNEEVIDVIVRTFKLI